MEVADPIEAELVAKQFVHDSITTIAQSNGTRGEDPCHMAVVALLGFLVRKRRFKQPFKSIISEHLADTPPSTVAVLNREILPKARALTRSDAQFDSLVSRLVLALVQKQLQAHFDAVAREAEA